MTIQVGDATRNAIANAIESTWGTSPVLTLRTGSPPANCAAADTGTLLGTATLPVDNLTAASGGAVSKNGTWQGTGSAAGTTGHYRIKTSGGTCEQQGTCGQSVGLTTNALTAANGNVLNFASTTGVVVGMNVSGTGIAAGTTVVATTGTTVTLSKTSTAGVANGASITFSPDMVIDNAVIAPAQTFTVTTYSVTAPNP